MTPDIPARITTDLAEIDLDTVHRWLSTSAFWAIGRTREQVQHAADHSLNLGLIDGDGQLRGYARVVTDYTHFAWLCDVFVDPDARGLGYGLMLAQGVVDALAPYHLKRILLITQDAHGLYEKVGFTPIDRPEDWMVLSAASADPGRRRP